MTDHDPIRERAADLVRRGRNDLQGLVGPLPPASEALRSKYLSWHEEVEGLLVSADRLDAAQLAILQSSRHRDIVQGVVPDEQLSREVGGERDIRLRLLDKLATTTTEDEATGGETLVGSNGQEYRYFPDRKLGEGGYGQVFEATSVDGLLLAVKVVSLRGHDTVRGHENVRLAEREIKVADKLSPGNSHVMPVIDHILSDDALYLVMPRAEYSLASLLRQGQILNEQEARDLFLNALAALTGLAEYGVLHRDIKPGNLLWLGHRWVLADFGIARIIEEDTSTYTWKGTGSHPYWAPEQFEFKPFTVRADLYALACTTLEALTGRPPFSGPDLAEAHRIQDPQVPELQDQAFRRALIRMLHKDPASRPSDAREVTQILTSPGSLQPDQLQLQLLAAQAEERRGIRERFVRETEVVEQQRESARAVFGTVWSELLDRAKEAVPDAYATNNRRTWILTVADARIAVKLTDPSISASTLLLGVVEVLAEDGPPPSLVANVRAVLKAGVPKWDLLKFGHNDLSAERPVLGSRFSSGKAGISMEDLDRLIDTLDEPGPPPVIIEVTGLTAQVLLTELITERAAITKNED